MIWAEALGLEDQMEVVFAVELLQLRLPAGTRAGAVDDQFLVRLQPTDHVHVEHGDGLVEWKDRLLAVAG